MLKLFLRIASLGLSSWSTYETALSVNALGALMVHVPTCRALGDADRHKGWNECVINLMDSIARSWCNSSKKWSEKWWGSRLDTQPGRQKFVYVILNKYWQKQVAGKEAIAVPADASPEVAARYAQHYFSEKAKAHGFGELDDRSAMVTVIGNLLMGPASAPAAKAASVLFAALMPFVTPIPGETKGLLKAIVRASWDNLESPHVADFFGAVAQSVGFSAGDGTVKALDLMANLPYAKSAREAVMPVAIALAGAADSPNQPWRLDEFDTPEGRRNVIQRCVGELVADRASAISSANDALVNCIWLIDNFVDHAPMIDAARALAVALLKMDAKLRAALFRSLGYEELAALLHHLTNVARNDPNAQAVSALVLELKSMLFT